jgi:hypothetical protein
MDLQDYKRLTNQLFSAIRNVETCSTERERHYTLSLLQHYSGEASVAYCLDASSNDIESMDLALQSVFDTLEANPQNRIDLGFSSSSQTDSYDVNQQSLKQSLH